MNIGAEQAPAPAPAPAPATTDDERAPALDAQRAAARDAARARMAAQMKAKQKSAAKAMESMPQEDEASSSQGPADDITKALISKEKVHTYEAARDHLRQVSHQLSTPEACDALLTRMTEVNDSDRTAFDTQTFRCFAEALANIRPNVNAHPLLDSIHRTVARTAAAQALRLGADIEDAVQQGMARFHLDAGYPMIRDDDIEALRLHTTQEVGRQQQEATGALRAPPQYMLAAREASTQAIRDGYSSQEAVQRGFTGFRLSSGHDPHPLDIEALRRHVDDLATNGGPPAPAHHFRQVINAATEALQSGLGAQRALQAAEERYAEVEGRPLTNPSELASLRLYVSLRRVRDGPRAQRHHLMARDKGRQEGICVVAWGWGAHHPSIYRGLMGDALSKPRSMGMQKTRGPGPLHSPGSSSSAHPTPSTRRHCAEAQHLQAPEAPGSGCLRDDTCLSERRAAPTTRRITRRQPVWGRASDRDKDY